MGGISSKLIREKNFRNKRTDPHLASRYVFKIYQGSTVMFAYLATLTTTSPPPRKIP